MPRSVEEILQHADELAARFEVYEPDPSDELDPSAVTALRTSGAGAVCCRASPPRRGGAGPCRSPFLVSDRSPCRTSGEAARQRYANKVA